jgi:hypothetical protein
VSSADDSRGGSFHAALADRRGLTTQSVMPEPNGMQRSPLLSTRLAPFGTNRCCGRERRRARVSVGQRPPRLGHIPDQSRGICHARGVRDTDRAHLRVERLAEPLVVPAVAPGDPGSDPRGLQSSGGYADAAGCRRARA